MYKKEREERERETSGKIESEERVGERESEEREEEIERESDKW